MKLIHQSFEIINQTDFTIKGIKKQIERCGRVCYTPDTEVLTDNGWKRIDSISETDKVVSYNPHNNTIIYDDPNLVVNDYADDLIEINHPNIKMCITKDHRIYQSVPGKRKYTFLKASHLAGIEKIPHSNQCRFRIPKNFIGSIKDIGTHIPKIEYSTEIKCGDSLTNTINITIPCNIDFMVIAGAFISDGHTYHGESHGAESYCQITQYENSELYSKIITALTNLGWPYRVYSDLRKTQIKWIRFGGNRYWVNAFDDLFGKKSSDKHLPNWFRKLPNEYLNTLMDAMYLSKGNHNSVRNERYMSTSKRLLDEVQEVFILLGRNGTVNFNDGISQRCYFEASHRDSWVVSRDKHISSIPYKGKVYCTSTKSGIICIRYKGKTCWCGNCYKSENKISDDSYEKFYNMVLKLKHGRPFEAGTIHLKMDVESFRYLRDLLFEKEKWNSIWIKYRFNPLDSYYYVTTNFRYYLAIVMDLGYSDLSKYIDEEDNELYNKRYTVRFITDRVTMDSFRTHVTLTHLGESTRYCDYSKDKFGKQITFIIPDKYDIKESDNYTVYDLYSNPDVSEEIPKYNWLNGRINDEISYKRQKSLGESPQYARKELSLSVKSELISCGFKDAWENFFAQRCASGAHPMARAIAVPLRDEFKKLGYIE